MRDIKSLVTVLNNQSVYKHPTKNVPVAAYQFCMRLRLLGSLAYEWSYFNKAHVHGLNLAHLYKEMVHSIFHLYEVHSNGQGCLYHKSFIKFFVADLMYEIDLSHNQNPCRDGIYRVSTLKFMPGFSNANFSIPHLPARCCKLPMKINRIKN